MATLEDGRVVGVPITCHSWQCDTCKHQLKRKLLRRLRYASPNLFITLTTSTRTAASPELAFPIANEAIGKLFKRWRRKFPDERVEYFLVWETTKAGWPHAHLLLSAPKVSKHWLSQTWRELTGSYIIDLQTVSNHQRAAGYLTKYLAKNPQVPTGQRRWRRSANFFDRSQEPPSQKLPTLSKWEREPYDHLTLAYKWTCEGYFVTQHPDGRIYREQDTGRRATLLRSQFWETLVSHVRTVAPGLLRFEDE